MKFNQGINAKALNIIREQNLITDYLRTCKQAKICPECGEVLIERKYPDLSKEENDNNIYSISECSKDKQRPPSIRYYDFNDE